MRAIVFTEPNVVRLTDVPDPQPRADRILIETLFSAVSWGTETAWLTGKMPYNYGSVPGYLSVGRVIHCGEETGRPEIAEGQVVWAGGYHAQRIDQIPEVVQPLPANLDRVPAAYAHLAAIGLHCLNRAEAKAGEALYVVGQGLLGQLTAQMGRVLGMRVVASEISQFRSELSRQYSCEQVFHPEDPQLREAINASGGPDVIVNSTGVPGLEDSLIELLKPRGRLVPQGMAPTVCYNLYRAHGKEVAILNSADATREEDRQSLHLLAEGELTVSPLITHRISPREAVELYTQSNKESILGTVIDWRAS